MRYLWESVMPPLSGVERFHTRKKDWCADETALS
jgi:hypothetical protein